MAGNTPVVGKSLIGSLTSLASTLVAIVHTRVELLSSDLDDVRSQVIWLLTLALVALFFVGVSVVLATILLVVAFWETDRFLVLGSLAGVYLAVGVAAGIFAVHMARTTARPFAATLSELRKDRQQLVSGA